MRYSWAIIACFEKKCRTVVKSTTFDCFWRYDLHGKTKLFLHFSPFATSAFAEKNHKKNIEITSVGAVKYRFWGVGKIKKKVSFVHPRIRYFIGHSDVFSMSANPQKVAFS